MKRFTVRTTKPGKANKEYTREADGGWSGCIKGKPTDANANVLSNCVGYAQGRLCEAYNEMFGTTGNKYFYLNCNAEDFVERAKAKYPNLKFSDDPIPGAIMCWRKGKAGTSSDGAGHVEFVETVIDKNTVTTTASNYGGTAFYTKTRKRGTGTWGLASPYVFRYFIYDPDMQIVLPTPVERDVWVDQVEVIKNNLRVRNAPSLSGDSLGNCPMGIYTIKKSQTADGYTWYNIDEDAWIANVTECTTFLAKKPYTDPTPVEKNEKTNQVYVGDVSLRIRAEANTSSRIQGLAKIKSFYDVEEVEQKTDYTWYKLGENAWIAGVDGVTYYPFIESPEVKELKAQIKTLNDKLNSVAKSLDTATSSIKTKDSEITTLNKKLSDAQAAVSTRDSKIKEVKDAIQKCLSILG